jgi:hypothetical protein
MKVTFTADFDFEPSALNGLVTIAYRQGGTYVVTRECAGKAIVAGKASETVKPEVVETK